MEGIFSAEQLEHFVKRHQTCKGSNSLNMMQTVESLLIRGQYPAIAEQLQQRNYTGARKEINIIADNERGTP